MVDMWQKHLVAERIAGLANKEVKSGEIRESGSNAREWSFQESLLTNILCLYLASEKEQCVKIHLEGSWKLLSHVTCCLFSKLRSGMNKSRLRVLELKRTRFAWDGDNEDISKSRISPYLKEF